MEGKAQHVHVRISEPKSLQSALPLKAWKEGRPMKVVPRSDFT